MKHSDGTQATQQPSPEELAWCGASSAICRLTRAEVVAAALLAPVISW